MSFCCGGKLCKFIGRPGIWCRATCPGLVLGVPTPEDIHVTAQAHRFMYEAAVAGDADAYCEAVVTHYQPLLGVLDSK